MEPYLRYSMIQGTLYKVHIISDSAYLMLGSSPKWKDSARSGNYLRSDLALMKPSTGSSFWSNWATLTIFRYRMDTSTWYNTSVLMSSYSISSSSAVFSTSYSSSAPRFYSQNKTSLLKRRFNKNLQRSVWLITKNSKNLLKC